MAAFVLVTTILFMTGDEGFALHGQGNIGLGRGGVMCVCVCWACMDVTVPVPVLTRPCQLLMY